MRLPLTAPLEENQKKKAKVIEKFIESEREVLSEISV